MTERMTARERAERCWQEFAFMADPYDMAIASIERAILADRAAERARLAQSGGVEGLVRELIAVMVPDASESDISDWLASVNYGADGNSEFDPDDFRQLARHVQLKLAATAKAARLEARDAIADIAETKMTGELDFNDIRALRPEQLEKKT